MSIDRIAGHMPGRLGLWHDAWPDELAYTRCVVINIPFRDRASQDPWSRRACRLQHQQSRR